ncbi:MAG TPA: glycosyltransferase [Jatrophihabitans sp.]|jgi:cellulose synthase/poly-beta-1,6-N-acetylglucosamine synthase-like glycosyltransferase|nr:glycosyltransferase [Jatrophihabitans sp.]
MLAALLLAGLIAAPLATIALFIRPVLHGRRFGAWAWTRRFTLALIGTALLAICAAGFLELLGATTGNMEGGAAGLIVVSLLWLPVTRKWSASAHLCWSATTFLFLAYLVFMIDWTFASHLGVTGTIGGLILWALELFAAFLGCAYLWELCDALGREAWLRRVPHGVATEELPAVNYLPFVSLHVPSYNEPPDMVIATLESLARLDYPNYEIIALDDNTSDEADWRPVEAWCLANNVKFVHLSDWPGYKSGALNYALQNMIDPRTELIGVVDADYQLDPQFLQRCAPLFADPQVGFIQAPQDYRDWRQAPFYRRLYYSYKYFFAVSQPSRNERDGAIFAGTMGLIRRAAIERAGGWDEWCITEDAELSLRLLRDGWSGLHVDRSFGVGVMPLTFEALKGQRFRWCFGGIQILRRHWRLMMPGRAHTKNRLDGGQRWAYFSGALQWYGDLVGLIFYLFLLVGAANLAIGGGLLFRKLTGFLLAAIPMLVLLGFVRAIALLRRGTGASWRDAFGAFMIWQATGLVVARASIQGLFAREAEFLRTPKTADDAHWWDAIRGNFGETLLAVLGLAGIVAAIAEPAGYGSVLTAALLLWPTIAYGSAPYNSLSAQRAALPPELRARRRSEYQRYRTARRVTYAVAGLAAAAAATAVAVGLLTPGNAPVNSPRLVEPARGNGGPAKQVPNSPQPGTTAPSSSAASTSGTPSSSSTTPTPTSTTPTPTPTTSSVTSSTTTTTTTTSTSATSSSPAG